MTFVVVAQSDRMHSQFHESQGVKFHMQVKVEKIVPASDDPSKAGGVVVNGQIIPADVVVVCPLRPFGARFPI
jgi:phytoene dehydrogenase-like protein